MTRFYNDWQHAKYQGVKKINVQTPLDDNNPTPDGELITRLIASPAYVNTFGNIAAGWLVEHMDNAGAHIAERIANGRVTTIAISNMVFLRPVAVGSSISFYVKCTEIGGSSIRICVEVWLNQRANTSNSDDEGDDKVTEGDFVFVAIDNQARTRSLQKYCLLDGNA